MMTPGQPDNEEEERRLVTLSKYHILDTLPEQEFDDLARLASQICQMPMSAISFVDRHRQWFKSRVGFETPQTPRQHSFCGHTILGKEPLVIEDTLQDVRFKNHFNATAGMRVRFYAGVPLIVPEGFALGAICVSDQLPRRLGPDQIEALQRLARQTVSQMRLRRTIISLAETQKLSSHTLDVLPTGVATLDQHGKILTVNRAWENFNHSRCAVAGGVVGSIYAMSHPHHLEGSGDGKPSFESQLTRLSNGEFREINHEYKQSSAEGDRWFGLTAVRCEDHPVHLIVTQTDISDRKRLETAETQRLSMQETLKSLEQTLGVVGHELRTPLAGLRVMTEFLMDPTARGTPEWAGFLSCLGDEVIRMSDTVDTILEAARLNSGRARWNFSTVDLESLCREVVTSAQMVTDSQSVLFDWKVDPAFRYMTGDHGAIRRLLLNLLANSRKHTTHGKIQIQVSGFIDTDANRWVELQVRDTGIGIPTEILDRLGDAFSLNSGVVDERCIGGTGLGLSICKGIASAHAGRLSIESRVGSGTNVKVKLRADLNGPQTSESRQDTSPLNHESALFEGVLAA